MVGIDKEKEIVHYRTSTPVFNGGFHLNTAIKLCFKTNECGNFSVKKVLFIMKRAFHNVEDRLMKKIWGIVKIYAAKSKRKLGYMNKENF